MTSRKTKRKNLIQILSLIVAVLLVVILSVVFQQWWNNRPEPLPQEISISASSPAGEIEVFPFSMCEPGVECEENEVPTLEVGADEELHLTIPEAIHDHDWYLLTIQKLNRQLLLLQYHLVRYHPQRWQGRYS